MPFNLDPALPRMTGASQADRGFEGILQILNGIPGEKLIQYRHKLSCSPQNRKSCHLLHAMILWSLRRGEEAREHLNSFGDDAAAHHLSQALWGAGRAKRTTTDQLKDQAEVAQSVAEIYSLLADEKLCDPLAGDEAFREAAQAFKASHVEGAQLQGLLDEAMDTSGRQLRSTVPGDNFGALGSGRRELTPAGRSSPVSIGNPSAPDNPQSLRSTESPVSYISLKISENSIATSDYPPAQGLLLSLPPTGQEGKLLVKDCSTNSGEPSPPNSRGPCLPPESKITLSPTASAQGPLTRRTASSGDLTRTYQAPPPRNPGSAPSAGSGPPRSSAPATTTGFGPQRSSSSSSSSSSDLAPCGSEPSSPMVPPDDERQFYTFVVLHAAEDELVAQRVKERLEALGVSNGATFSEDFLISGRSQLNCFQNALDNSAFTLVLLTRNFTGRLHDYQRDTALMDSITRCCKRHSVIPFVPREHSLAAGEMPFLLATLVPLCEESPVFDKRVRKTFTPKVIREKKAAWDLRRRIQEREEERERERENWRLQQQLAALHLQPPGVDLSRMQAQAGDEARAFPPSAPSFVALGLDQASFSPPFLPSMGSPNAGPAPQLIIQNAQMIQIGDCNRMQVERSNPAVGTAHGTGERAPVAEREDGPPSLQKGNEGGGRRAQKNASTFPDW